MRGVRRQRLDLQENIRLAQQIQVRLRGERVCREGLGEKSSARPSEGSRDAFVPLEAAIGKAALAPQSS